MLCVDAANPRSYSGSGNTVNDLSGNTFTGTTQGGVTFSSLNSGSLVFDGTNDFMYFASPAPRFSWTPSGTGLKTISVEVWVKTSDTNGRIVSKPWNGNGWYNYGLLHNQLAIQNNTAATLNFTSLATGNWEHVVFIITPTQMAVYRNGLLNAGFTNHGITGNLPPDTGDISVPLSVMTLYSYADPWAGDTNQAVAGNVSVFRVYNVPLSADTVRGNFNALRSRYGV